MADEIAGAADLVKGKASGLPVAVVRGLGRLVGSSKRRARARWCAQLEDDMFRFGSAEAYQLGYDAARAELKDTAPASRGAKQET